jgi:hypothetical protein
MAQLIGIKLSRFDATPWGFRLQGGKDFGGPLRIQKVRPVFSIGIIIIAPAYLVCYFYRTEIVLMRGDALLLIAYFPRAAIAIAYGSIVCPDKFLIR